MNFSFFKKIKSNTFLKNSMLYTLGSMLTPLVGFIMLPVYTTYLSTEEYGIMTTVTTITGMLTIFLMLSLRSAVTRFYYEHLDSPTTMKKYISTIFTFVLIFSTIGAIILILLYQPIGNIIFRNIPLSPYYFYLIGLSWVNGLYELPMSLFRAQEQAGKFVFINITKAFLTMTFTIYLIVYMDMGAESALLSQLVIASVITLVTYGGILVKVKFHLNKQYIKESLYLSLPMIPHLGSGWIIASSDRVILEKFVALGELGVYSLAVQISMVLSIFYTGVNQALVPRYTRLLKENNIEKANKLLKNFNIIILGFGLLSIPIAMIATNFIVTDNYKGAILLLPLLLLGHMIKGFYYVPVAKLFYAKKTKAIASSSTLAAITNIVINLMLIPFIGVYGAIVSTIVAEIIRYLLININSKKVQYM